MSVDVLAEDDCPATPARTLYAKRGAVDGELHIESHKIAPALHLLLAKKAHWDRNLLRYTVDGKVAGDIE